jgi:hypothetical protein
MNSTSDPILYLKAAYAVAGVIYLGYLGSLWLRFRRLREEMRELKRQ